MVPGLAQPTALAILGEKVALTGAAGVTLPRRLIRRVRVTAAPWARPLAKVARLGHDDRSLTMRIARNIGGHHHSLDTIRNEAKRAVEDGLAGVWMSQIFGPDALT